MDMAHDGEPPPPKRRRTDHPPSNETIAQTNATLQLLTAGRQNRWMHGFVQQVDTQTPNNVGSRVNGANDDAPRLNSSISSSLDQNGSAARAQSSASITEASALELQQERLSDNCAPSLVAYQIPQSADAETMFGLPTPAVNTFSSNGRKSWEAYPRSSLPGLPSPAPSDENTNSPTFAESRIPPLQRSRPSISTRQYSGVMNPVGAQHLSYASPVDIALPTNQVPQQFISNVPHPALRGPVQRAAAFAQPNIPQHAHAHVANHQPRPLPNGTQVGNSVAAHNYQAAPQPLPVPAILPSNSPLPQSPLSSDPLQASRFPTEVLLQSLDEAERRISATTALSPTDSGRLMLLREAVRRGDWFYQVLSQLFCMRTTSPSLLPQSVRNLNNKSYTYLSTLLCAHTEINSELLRVFTDFPEDIMAIYSGSALTRDLFEQRVQRVKMFLEKLPAQWDRLVSDCRKIPSPPLVQDLVERLRLQSVVLQTTAFRAIARMLYGIDSDPRCIAAVEKIHRIDQDTYLRKRHARNDIEKHEAYLQMRKVFDHSQRQKLLQGHRQVDFAVPQDVVEFFNRQPQSVTRRLQVSQMQQPQYQVQGQPIQQAQPQQLLGFPNQSNQHQQSQQLLQDRLLAAQAFRSGIRGSTTALHAAQSTQLQLHGRGGSAVSTPRPLQQNQSVARTPHNPTHPRRFYPLISETPRPQPTQPTPATSAVHQAHLRSPVIAPNSSIQSVSNMYRHVVGFALPPTKLKKSLACQKISVQIDASTIARVAQTRSPDKSGERQIRLLDEQSLMFRLRCAILPPQGFAKENAWVSADNYWPENLYFVLNQTKLEARRKLHNGRHLPIDVTAIVKGGVNELQVYRDKQRHINKPIEYALAIEVIGVKTHQNIIGNVRRIPTEESLSGIKASLATLDSDAGDDDVAVTSSSMTVKLFDPYSGCKIFDLPVRGATCLHKDCFDLETFLNMCKRDQPGHPTIVDCWRCPLCRGDVRPQELVLDEFLLEVRRELAARNLLDTRAIAIEADGTWTHKHEKATGVRSASLEREESGSSGAVQRGSSAGPVPAGPPKVIEVIELD